MALTKAQTVATRKLFLWDEINSLVSQIIQFSKSAKEAESEFEDYLIDAYIEGFAGANYMLSGEETPDANALYAALNKTYDGESIFEKFAVYYAAEDAEKIKRLIESEFHRMNEQGGYDAASAFGGNVKKVWSAILDDKTRLTHDILDGTTVGIGERFYSISGDSALFPGDFETAEENCRCRCHILYKAEYVAE